MINEEIVHSNLIACIEKQLPLTTRTSMAIDLVIDEDIAIIDPTKYSFMGLGINTTYGIHTLIGHIMRLYNTGKYDLFHINLKLINYDNKINDLYDIIRIERKSLSARCKECSRLDLIQYSSDVEICEGGFKFNCCCRKDYKIKTRGSKGVSTDQEEFFIALKQYFEKQSINKGKLILKDRYRIQCRNSHIVRIQGGDALSYKKCDSEIKCWVCEDKIDEKYAFFKLLKELGANYFIEERFKDGKEIIGISLYLKKISRLIIYTYNDKKHLTGKIVFSDLLGEHQAKAKANGLIFRWFDIKYIDDYEYCKVFFEFFFRGIVKLNNLMEERAING